MKNETREDAGYRQIPELKLLSDEEIKKAIWDMGIKAERDGLEITQRMRFYAIAQAQLDSIKKQIEGEK